MPSRPDHKPIGDGLVDAVGDSDHDGFVTLKYARVVKVTNKATLVSHDGEQFWIPDSVLRVVLPREHYGDIDVREWFAVREGIV